MIKIKTGKGWLRKILKGLILKTSIIFLKGNQSNLTLETFIPQKILVLNGAHVGDIVITTSILPVLRSAYPDAQIGFAVGSWASMVIHDHKEIQWVHIIDHWKHNRGSLSFLRKYLQYLNTRRKALGEIKKVNYDLALCVYPFFLPDFMDIAMLSKIPVRLGFNTSLFSSFATTTVSVPSSLFVHQSEIQLAVLNPLGLKGEHTKKINPTLPAGSIDAIQEVSEVLGFNILSNSNYVIIHVGTGDPKREKSREFWMELAYYLAKDSIVVFTGKGSRESQSISSIIEGLENCINACDQLSWGGFVTAVKFAKKLYGVESMAGHVASAVETKSIVVYSGAAGVPRWRPGGTNSIVFSNHLACAPCQLPWGCKTMDCLSAVSAGDVIAFSSLGKQ